MNSRAMRILRLRNQAWAVVVALLASTESRGMQVQDSPSAGPQTTTYADVTASPASAVSAPGRTRIPPPRQFSPLDLQDKASTSVPPSKIPPPHRFVTPSIAEQQVAKSAVEGNTISPTMEAEPGPAAVTDPIVDGTTRAGAPEIARNQPATPDTHKPASQEGNGTGAQPKTAIEEFPASPAGQAAVPAQTPSAMPVSLQKAVSILSSSAGPASVSPSAPPSDLAGPARARG